MFTVWQHIKSHFSSLCPQDRPAVGSLQASCNIEFLNESNSFY